MAHEIGHGAGLKHAPCSVTGTTVDASYPAYEPYDPANTPRASIGEYGLDITNGTLHPPTDKDYMSYCGPAWISLYNPRRRLQHAEIVRARANHLARLAGDRRIRGECRRSEQRDDTCGHPPQASRPSPMNSAVTPAPATVSRIYFISSSDRPSAPSIERNTAPPVDNSTRAVTS